MRVLAVITPAAHESQSGSVSRTPGKQVGQADSSVAPEETPVAQYRVSTRAALGLLIVFAAAAIAVLLGNHLGK